MEHIGIEQQVSITVEDPEILDADSEIDSCNFNSVQFRSFSGNGMIQLEEGTSDHSIIRKGFLKGMGSFGNETEVVAIHRNSFSGLTGQARLETFRIFSAAVGNKCGGNANIKYAWYGASRDEICEIISHGFSQCRRPQNSKSYGLGVYLSPANLSIDGALSSAVDENGLRHLLLCRVILGKTESVCGGSEQFQPSSMEFDSGVDNLSAPTRYIIWSAYMNSHILPDYIISFKAPRSIDLQRNWKPNSPYMRFPKLMSILANYLHPSKMALIAKHHSDFRANKITRSQLVRRLRQIAGDELLIVVIKESSGQMH